MIFVKNVESMFHYEIKVDSLAYRKIYDSLEAYAKWLDDQTREKVCRLLSIKSAEGIYFSPGRLVMDSPPDHLKKQFEGPNKRGQYSARASSSLNRKWVRFCMLNNLNFIYPQDILDYEFNLVEAQAKKFSFPLALDSS